MPGSERGPSFTPLGALALSFDDGPDPIWTPQVLRALREYEARATFFVLGERVRAAPELVDAIRADGHAIELHGDRHLDHSRSSPDALSRDTEQALTTLQELGVEPRLWRLPWGRKGPATPSLAADWGLQLVGWDYDTHDWRGDRWLDQPGEVRRAPELGGVALLHDAIGPGQPRSCCENTLELTRELLLAARENGVNACELRVSAGAHG